MEEKEKPTVGKNTGSLAEEKPWQKESLRKRKVGKQLVCNLPNRSSAIAGSDVKCSRVVGMHFEVFN